MRTQTGYFYTRLREAVAVAGSPRSVYSQDTTLSRRGLLTRADRRARELSSAGVGAGEIVTLSMGNVAEFLVLLLACSKLGAVAMPVDPSDGNQMLLAATKRLPVRAVIRRPRGLDASALQYPPGYVTRSRKRLASSLLTLDVLDAGDQHEVTIAPNAELIMEARGIGGAVRDTVRTAAQLDAIGEAAAVSLGLDAGAKLLCTQPLTVPRFFDTVVMGWLASAAQLVMAESPALKDVLPIARSYDHLIAVDSVRQFLELSRVLKAAASTLSLTAVIPQATVPIGSGRMMKRAFEHAPRQLLLLEEVGILASRVMERGEHFQSAPGVELRAGATMTAGGHEVQARSSQAGAILPLPPPGDPASPVDDDGFVHTGYAGKFNKGSGALVDVLGRDDGLVNIEGRRACLDNVEDVMLEHRRLTWVRAFQVHTSDGDPEVHLEYHATGQTPVDDIEEHAVGNLPPFMVPREFKRLRDAPAGP